MALAALGWLVAVVGTGCVSSYTYHELQEEMNALRYQYQLERLYVAGLRVQNDQLWQKKRDLQAKINNAAAQR
jgi:hypothetical protein